MRFQIGDEVRLVRNGSDNSIDPKCFGKLGIIQDTTQDKFYYVRFVEPVQTWYCREDQVKLPNEAKTDPSWPKYRVYNDNTAWFTKVDPKLKSPAEIVRSVFQAEMADVAHGSTMNHIEATLHDGRRVALLNIEEAREA